MLSTLIGSIVLCMSTFRAGIAAGYTTLTCIQVTNIGLGKPIYALNLTELQIILKASGLT